MRRLVLLVVGLTALLVNTVLVSGGGAETGVRPVGKIAYAEGGHGICVVTADGRTRRCYLARPFVADMYESPTWSLDGRRIAFQMNVDCGRVPFCLHGIFAVNADGSDLHRVAPAPGADDRDPAWSPRGSKIAFARWTYPDAVSGIYIADADRPRVRRLFQLPVGDSVRTPAWSPDGRRIAFSTGSSERLFVMNAGGSRVRELKFGGRDPRWSPNGRKLLVARSGDLYVMNADGTRVRRVAREAWGGAWSPNGRQIVFTCDSQERRGRDICVVNADGSSRGVLAWEPNAVYVTPAWSPSGQWISYVRYGLSSAEIMVISADGDSSVAGIPLRSQVNGTPVWQPIPR